ncbi:hypothetical protein [Saccharospirillum salsuginis]|nr:hypothetical protein [Saccharospirillum salsuginis]
MEKLTVTSVLFATIALAPSTSLALKIQNSFDFQESPSNLFYSLTSSDYTLPNPSEGPYVQDMIVQAPSEDVDNLSLLTANIINEATRLWAYSIGGDTEVNINWNWADLSTGKYSEYEGNTITLNSSVNNFYFDRDVTSSSEYIRDDQYVEYKILDDEYEVDAKLTKQGNMTYNPNHHTDDGIYYYDWADLQHSVDLFSVALYEVGHVLGYQSNKVGTSSISVEEPLPLAGMHSEIDWDNDASFIQSGHSMSYSVSQGERKILTVDDVLILAQLNGWTDVYLPEFHERIWYKNEVHNGWDFEYDLHKVSNNVRVVDVIHVNEPSNILMLFVGLFLLFLIRNYNVT